MGVGGGGGGGESVGLMTGLKTCCKTTYIAVIIKVHFPFYRFLSFKTS